MWVLEYRQSGNWDESDFSRYTSGHGLRLMSGAFLRFTRWGQAVLEELRLTSARGKLPREEFEQRREDYHG